MESFKKILDALNGKQKLGKWLLFGGGFVVLYSIYKYLKSGRRGKIFKLDQIFDFENKVKDVNTFDVVIVGCGVSSCVCAYYLSKFGKKVLIVDKLSQFKDLGEISILSGKSLDILNEMNLSSIVEEKSTLLRTQGFVSSNSSFVGTTNQKKIRLIEKLTLKTILVDLIKEIGVEVKFGCDVTKLRWSPVNDQFTIRTSTDNFDTKVTILSEGTAAELAKSFKVITKEPNGYVTRKQLKKNSSNIENIIFKLKGNGVGMVSSLKNGKCELSCFVPSSKELDPPHAEMKELLPFLEDQISSLEWKAVRVNDKSVELERDNLLIIGSESGNIDPFLGNSNVNERMVSAKLASFVILDSFTKNDFSSKQLSKYSKQCKQIFSNSWYWSKAIQKLFQNNPSYLYGVIGYVQSNPNVINDFTLAIHGEYLRRWFLTSIGMGVVYNIIFSQSPRKKVNKK